MLQDLNYKKDNFRLSEIPHKYGPNVHLLSDPYLFTLLAKLCEPSSHQPLVNQLLDKLYREILKYAVNQEFPKVTRTVVSRMAAYHPEGNFAATVLDPSTKAVSVNLARAGTVPSHICYDALNYLLNPDGLRQDHISINRQVNEKEQVIGCNLGGMKIGGPVDGHMVLIPDPMGATGSTIISAREIYGKFGVAKKFIALHLIVTPEYLANVLQKYPDTVVYAIRLDRGLSPEKCFQTEPGTHWKEERGLNEKQYIVPGGGGLGEVINNSYV